MKTLLLSVAAWATATAAKANDPNIICMTDPNNPICTSVPEISAMEGAAAIAALAAIMLLTWERRRRAS